MRRGTARAGGGGLKNLSNWRSVRLWETRVEQQLRQRHVFWLHGVCIGLVTLGITWGASHVQMRLGIESLALRYLVSLGLGFLGYLLMLRLWAGALVRKLRDPAHRRDWGQLDMGWPGGGSSGPGSASVRIPPLQSGGGGHFGGGGAGGDFSGAADALSAADTASGVGGMGDLVGGALDAAGSADEAAVVVGSLLLAYFGWEALLAVAVELAFSYASARVAVRVVREGWLSAALRLTWKPLLGSVVCAVILGAAIDYFVPAAHSLPQAIKLLRAPAR